VPNQAPNLAKTILAVAPRQNSESLNVFAIPFTPRGGDILAATPGSHTELNTFMILITTSFYKIHCQVELKKSKIR
jgi:hypothetical protein